jgi:hypothetical protein
MAGPFLVASLPSRRHGRAVAQRREPAIHRFREKMDARVKPARDAGMSVGVGLLGHCRAGRSRLHGPAHRLHGHGRAKPRVVIGELTSRRHGRAVAQRRDPAIHRFREKMDARVKPARDRRL